MGGDRRRTRLHINSATTHQSLTLGAERLISTRRKAMKRYAAPSAYASDTICAG